MITMESNLLTPDRPCGGKSDYIKCQLTLPCKNRLQVWSLSSQCNTLSALLWRMRKRMMTTDGRTMASEKTTSTEDSPPCLSSLQQQSDD